MLLTSLPPSTLPDGLANQLASLGILTSTDLIFTSSLETYTRLSSKSISFPDFKACIEAISAKLATQGQETNALHHELRSDFRMETLLSLDDQLGGGLPCARVIEFSGDSLGKSSLLLNLVLKALLKNTEIEALWIDTTGDFAIERTVRILEHQQISPDDMEAILRRLYISTAIDFESVQEIIRALTFQFALQTPMPRMKCIVIDSVTALLGPYLSAVSSQGHAIMAIFMQYLRDLARRYSVLILVGRPDIFQELYSKVEKLVNNATLMQVTSTNKARTAIETISNPHSVFGSTIRKPALGPSFTFMTDATLWVSLWPKQEENEERSTCHVIEVFRSKFSISNIWSAFKINSSGVLQEDRTILNP